jgi:hypothetical protein
MSISLTVIWERLTNAFTPWCFATTATLAAAIEIGRGDRHGEADAVAAFDRPVYGHDVEQIANHHLGAERAQPRGSLVIGSYLRPHPKLPGEKQLRHGAAHGADPSGRAGDENRKVMLCFVHLPPRSD